MADFAQKRIEYINNWPNSVLFEAEQNYKQRCDAFEKAYGKLPFSPMKMWHSSDDTFNRAISHLIDSLEMMPLKPNFAFTFLFSGLDFFAKKQYGRNTNDSLKNLATDIFSLSAVNADVNNILAELFASFSVNTSIYLYKNLCLQSNIRRRVVTNMSNTDIPAHVGIVDAINNKYGYDTSNYNASIRQAALLYRKIFSNDNLTISGNSMVISNEFRLYLLLLGFIYSLRNDAMHGSSMSSTKSSKTSPKRYALNFYAFLSAYTIFMLLLIMKSPLTQAEKNQKYADLKQTTAANMDDFKKLFGNHIN